MNPRNGDNDLPQQDGGPDLDAKLDEEFSLPLGDSDSDQATDETVHLTPDGMQSTIDLPEPARSESDRPDATHVFAGRGQSTGQPNSDATEETVDLSTESIIGSPFGIGQQPDDSQTENIETTVDLSVSEAASIAAGSIDLGSVQLRPAMDGDVPKASVMESADIGQTINPRELSDKDAAFWGSVTSGSGTASPPESTRMGPAIERSINETKLQIRARDLATPARDPSASSDYRLVRLLGKGGMGNVYVAKQTSLDRMIAVKVIKPLSKSKRKKLDQSGRLEEVEHERRQQFLSEAVVTGDLDHPNIVPIHDIAVAEDKTLFYAMKRVQGKPWSKLIGEKTRDENLEILLKACDAIAFAHTRGVIHRDIKPENIMLGDFGEVLVMDWGLALAKPEFEKMDSITATAGLGGTPAFMAPEMAMGPIEQIGPRSDIYLLGATLFYIITGHAPHRAANVSLCIRAVASNDIHGIEPQHEGELLDIALRAMATEPEERFEDVKQFQDAIRSYRSHAESVALSTGAAEHYQNALSTGQYELYSRATFGFEQAIQLWSGNKAAIKNLNRIKIDHARAAYANEDFDLGLSLLDSENPDHSQLIQKLHDGQHQRELKASRLKLFRRLVAASLAFILVGGSIALFLINYQRNEAIAQRANAQDAEARALRDRDIAESERANARTSLVKEQAARAEADEQRNAAQESASLAKEAKKVAEAATIVALEKEEIARKALVEVKKSRASEVAAKVEAVKSAIRADKERQKAEYESYLSQIGLAKARIDQNEFDSAREILRSIRESRSDRKLAWEWRWLWEQANQSSSLASVPEGVSDLVASRDGTFVVATTNDGSLVRFAATEGRVSNRPNVQWSDNTREATCVAISQDGKQTAIGTELGEIHVLDSATALVQQQLRGHEGPITDLEFLPEGRLVSASTDRSLSLWDVTTGKRVDTAWHIAGVLDLDLSTASSNSPVLAAAVSDGRTGRAVGWRIDGRKFERLGEFKRHSSPVTSVAVSPDGSEAASGDSRGNVFLWKTGALFPTNYQSSIENAIATIENNAESNPDSSSLTPVIAQWRAHPDSISSLQFDQSGEALYSSSEDYTIRKWIAKDQTLAETIRGHGGWVSAFDLVDGDNNETVDWIVSGSADGTIRTWEPGKKPKMPPGNPSAVRNGFSSARPSAAESEKFVAAKFAKTTGKSLPPLDSMTTFASSNSNAGRPTYTQQPSPSVRDQQLHQDEILAARFDADGNRVITASRDHTARILGIDRSAMSFSELARIQTNAGSFANGTESFANGTESFANGTETLAEGTEFLAMSAEVDSDGKRLFVGSADSTIRIWDLNAGTQIGQIDGTGLNNAFAISADGRRLLSGSSGDGKAILWDIDPRRTSPKQLHRLSGHEQAVTSYALSSDGATAVTGDRAGRCIVWNAKTGEAIGRPLDMQRGFRINQLMIGNSDRSLWIASDGRQLVEIELSSRTIGRRFDHDGFVTSFSFSHDGSQVVTVSQSPSEKEIKTVATLWDAETQRPTVLDDATSILNSASSKSKSSARINSARFSSHRNQVLVCAKSDSGRSGRVTLIDTDNRTRERFELPTRIGTPELGLLLADDRMLTLNGQAAFRWNVPKRIHEKSYRSHSVVNVACFSPDGKVAATASRSVRFWNPTTGDGIDKLETPHQGAVTAMDLSSLAGENTYLIATAGNDLSAKLWSWKNRNSGFQLYREIKIPGSRVNAVKFSPAGDRLMIAGIGGTVQVIPVDQSDVTNKARTITFSIGTDVSVTCCSFSADGRWLAVGGSDKIATLFDLTGTEAAVPIQMRGHAGRIESIAILQDASDQLRILTASRDKSLRAWDPRLKLLAANTAGNTAANTADKRELKPHQAREVISLRKHTQGLTAVGCTKTGDLVMSAGRDGRVLLWPSRDPRTVAFRGSQAFTNCIANVSRGTKRATK